MNSLELRNRIQVVGISGIDADYLCSLCDGVTLEKLYDLEGEIWWQRQEKQYKTVKVDVPIYEATQTGNTIKKRHIMTIHGFLDVMEVSKIAYISMEKFEYIDSPNWTCNDDQGNKWVEFADGSKIEI